MTQLKKLRGVIYPIYQSLIQNIVSVLKIPTPASPSFSHYMYVIYKVKTSVLGADEIFDLTWDRGFLCLNIKDVKIIDNAHTTQLARATN